MQSDIREAVRSFLAENFLFREGMESLGDDDSFLGAGIIDSTGVLELIFFLENGFQIKVADEDMLPENLDSVRAVTAYVQRKLARGSVEAA